MDDQAVAGEKQGTVRLGDEEAIAKDLVIGIREICDYAGTKLPGDLAVQVNVIDFLVETSAQAKMVIDEPWKISRQLSRRTREEAHQEVRDMLARAPISDWHSDLLAKGPGSRSNMTLANASAVFDTACKTCDCKGHVRCGSCSGAGSTTCLRCFGTKSHLCYDCKHGGTKCYMCSGSGRQTRHDPVMHEVRCQTCNGRGETGTCGTCMGTRQAKCPGCKGAGSVKCSSCSGGGTQKCGHCAGLGATVHQVDGRIVVEVGREIRASGHSRDAVSSLSLLDLSRDPAWRCAQTVLQRTGTSIRISEQCRSREIVARAPKTLPGDGEFARSAWINRKSVSPYMPARDWLKAQAQDVLSSLDPNELDRHPAGRDLLALAGGSLDENARNRLVRAFGSVGDEAKRLKASLKDSIVDGYRRRSMIVAGVSLAVGLLVATGVAEPLVEAGWIPQLRILWGGAAVFALLFWLTHFSRENRIRKTRREHAKVPETFAPLHIGKPLLLYLALLIVPIPLLAAAELHLPAIPTTRFGEYPAMYADRPICDGRTTVVCVVDALTVIPVIMAGSTCLDTNDPGERQMCDASYRQYQRTPEALAKGRPAPRPAHFAPAGN